MTDIAKQKKQLARINCKLAPKYTLKVLKAQSESEEQCFGDHYLIDTRQNKVLDTHLNLDVVEKVVEEAITLHEADTALQPRGMDQRLQEALAFRFVQKLAVGIPDPAEFSKDELDLIASWCGMAEKVISAPEDGRPAVQVTGLPDGVQ